MKNVFLSIILLFLLIESFAQAKPLDVVFNELMIKPEPSVTLPPYEYIELFNRTEREICIKDWKLYIGSTAITLPNYNIEPKGYLIVVNQANDNEFIKYINVIAVPSLRLNDNAQALILYDNLGQLISQHKYNIANFSTDVKSKGGWSLEQIDPDNPCAGVDNWRFSISRNGGTPAMQNSVMSENKDNTPPHAVRISYIDDQNIFVHFSEPILSQQELSNVFNYVVNNGIGIPDSVSIASNDNQMIRLKLASKLQKGIIYTLSIIDGTLCDCVGNMLLHQSKLEFGIPDEIGNAELLLSEIMFNPYNAKSQWIEIFNNSTKLFDLSHTSLIFDSKVIFPPTFYIFPHQYIVIKKETMQIGNYITPHPDNIVSIVDLPTMNSTSGTVSIADKGDQTIIFDEMYYNSNMHSSVIRDTKGVSLERISTSISAMDLYNWQSGAEQIAFATPTYKNSVTLDPITDNQQQWTLSSEIFSPDNDGYDDVLGINYSLLESGQTATINIYNSRGVLIRNLTNNFLLSANGIIIWNGMDNKNQRVEIGIYIISIITRTNNGKQLNTKLTIVVATNL